MRIALVSSFVPFVLGGARNIVEWLEQHLLAAGHEVEIVYLPFEDEPERLFPQLAAYRQIDLTEHADLVVCFRPPAHLVRHPRKVLWFIHHLRYFYDLWDTQYRHFPDSRVNRERRRALFAADSAAIHEARHVFTNSRIVSSRLQQFNAIESEVLYPPIPSPERFQSTGQSDEIVYLARIEHHKRQHLLLESLALTKTPVRLRLAGASSSPEYVRFLHEHAVDLGVADRFKLEDRWISEAEKASLLGGCLAAAYIPLDEDSYGYPSLEASHSAKPILTTSDSGGVLELVTDGVNGLVAEPHEADLAAGMDRFYEDREATRRMGEAALARLAELEISWDRVIERILS